MANVRHEEREMEERSMKRIKNVQEKRGERQKFKRGKQKKIKKIFEGGWLIHTKVLNVYFS